MRKDENYSTFVNLRSLHYRMAGKQYCIKSNAVLYEGQKVYWTLEGELISEQILMGEKAEKRS